MEQQYKRAEIRDAINSLLAFGALPYAALLLLDAFEAGFGATDTIQTLGWIAKACLAIVVLVCVVMIVRKWRAGGTRAEAAEIESYSTSLLFRSATVSWGLTLVILAIMDNRYRSLLEVMGVPFSRTGDVTAALMLIVFSLAYFGSTFLSNRAEARAARL